MPLNSGQTNTRDRSSAADREEVQDESVNERFEQLIAEADWRAMTQRLLRYASSRLARYGLRSDARAPMDYVLDAVCLTFERRRHFPSEPGVPLFKFLAGVVDSLISHDAHPDMITRTIKPAVGSSRVSAEEARAAARLVYRDEKTGRFAIIDGERLGRTRGRVKKRAGAQSHPGDVAKHAEGSSRHSSSPRANGKKR